MEYAILNCMAYSSLRCPIVGCEHESRQEKRFLEHIAQSHGLDPETCYIDHVLGGQHPACACGCGQKTPWAGWKRGHGKYLRGHNARVYTAFSDPSVIKKCVDSRMESYREGRHSPWNAGLKSESDERLSRLHEKASTTLKQRYASGELISWQAGLTAETDERLRRMSETKSAQYSSGEKRSWNEGLTKCVSPSLARAAQKISTAYEEREAGKRLAPEEVQSRVSSAEFDLLDGDYRTRKGTCLRVRCRKCHSVQERTLYSIEETRKCFICCPKESSGHLEILEFVRQLAPDVVSNSRDIISPLELDIAIPSVRLAIEYNGLYWHSESHRGKSYHSDKTRAAADAGYRLIHVFEDEWRDRRPIVESMLQYRMRHVTSSVGARECEIARVDHKQRKDFFDACHIDGDVRSTSAWGLFHRGELAACLSIRRPVHRKWHDWVEVARFAVLPSHSIPGALSRLSSHALSYARAEKKVGLMSYVDTRYGDGAGYISAGFKQYSRSGPTFWWTDFNTRFNRFAYRADPARGLTEEQVARESGMSKIWGCDQLIMTLADDNAS